MSSCRYRRITLLAGLVLGCAESAPAPEHAPPAHSDRIKAPMVIANADQLDAAVGQVVTVRGVVSNSKIPTILGVDIESELPDLRGQLAQATGVLRRQVVTQEEIDARIAESGQYAHRGPGTFYSLARTDGTGLAAAQPVGSPHTLPASGQSLDRVICDIARDIEALKSRYRQLVEFSAQEHCDPATLTVSYGYHTHRAQGRAGWAGAVPNPDPDGVWLHIDFHDPSSASQLHTQPVVPPRSIADKKVTFLILEGKDTKSITQVLEEILRRHGVRETPPR